MPSGSERSAAQPLAALQRVVTPALENVAEQARGLTHRLGSVGAGAVSSLPLPVRNLVSGLLRSLDQLPPVTAELDVVVAELHAKRLSVQALQSELGALDKQLEVLERSLAPVQAWTHQAGRLRASLERVLVDAGDDL